jgi:hypothetical protein
MAASGMGAGTVSIPEPGECHGPREGRADGAEIPDERPRMSEDSGLHDNWTMDNSTEASNPGRVRLNVWCWLIHKPFWPAVWAGGLALAVALAVLHSWVWWVAVGLLALVNLLYWVGLRERFRAGCINPGLVVAVEPTLVAVGTDLSKGLGEYPAIKIIRAPLWAIGGQPVLVGMRLATVATYSEGANPEEPHWVDFTPHPVQLATFDEAEIARTLSSIDEEDWPELEEALRQVPQPYRPGLYLIAPRDE